MYICFYNLLEVKNAETLKQPVIRLYCRAHHSS